MMDRTQRPYWNGITPDVAVAPSPQDTPDKTIEAAKRWLWETN
ncbi:hypothetical protein [Hymenobacter crusticola]|nr:hypothetical protein [Hymenobacter crusticola]